MKNKSIDSELLLTCLNNKKIITIGELKSTLRTQYRMTVFRKLSMLGYIEFSRCFLVHQLSLFSYYLGKLTKVQNQSIYFSYVTIQNINDLFSEL